LGRHSVTAAGEHAKTELRRYGAALVDAHRDAAPLEQRTAFADTDVRIWIAVLPTSAP
jgi:hypothetical protein